MTRFGTGRALSFGAMIAACTVGCSSGGVQYAEVSGKVSVKGAPVTAGQVYFKLDGTEFSGSAPIRADGTYSSKSIPVGKCKVLVQTSQFNPKPQEAKGSSSGSSSSGKSSGPTGSGGPSGSGGPGSSSSRPPPGASTKVPDWVSKTNPNEPPPGKYVATPAKYESIEKTTLEFEVKSGSNTYDIDLKD